MCTLLTRVGLWLSSVSLALLFCGCRLSDAHPPVAVGQSAADFGQPIPVPVNQILTPAGDLVELPEVRPQVLALSPDGTLLATSGKHELILINPQTGKIRQKTPLPLDVLGGSETNLVSEQILNRDQEAEASYSGLVFSPDSKRIYLSNVRGDIKVLAVSPDGGVSPLHSLPLPATGLSARKAEIPAGLALSADGKRLYVAGNLSNRLLELDAGNGKTLRTFEVRGK